MEKVKARPIRVGIQGHKLHDTTTFCHEQLQVLFQGNPTALGAVRDPNLNISYIKQKFKHI